MRIHRPLVVLATALLAPAAAVATPPDDPPHDPPHDLGPILEHSGERVTTTVTGRATAPAAGGFGVNGFDPRQVNVNGLGGNILGDAGNEPSIAVDPTAPNRIAIGWRQFDTVTNSFRQAGWGWSNDGGRTWTFPGVIEPGIFRSDPVLDYDAEGNFYYNSLKVVGGSFTCQIFKSADGGMSWDGGVEAFGGDKQWMAIDRTGGIGHGNVYCAWSPAAACCGTNLWTRSSDGGAFFETPLPFPDAPRFGTMDVGPGGDQYTAGVQSIPFNSSVFLCVRSSNAQNPMQIPVFDITVNVDMQGSMRLGGGVGPNPGGLLGQADVGVFRPDDELADHVYLSCSVTPIFGSDPLDVYFARSLDGGASWSSGSAVNDDSDALGQGWQWFTTMGVAPNGRIDLVWLDTKNDPTDTTSELYYTTSMDEGDTWTDPIAATIPFNSLLGFPQQNKMGDYFDMISDDVGANLAMAATFNGEQDVYYLRLGDYDCNGNAVGDTLDLADLTSNDCNGNDIPDECEIAAGAETDRDGNGIPDSCQLNCPADTDGDGDVDVDDLNNVILDWGTDGSANNGDITGPLPGSPPDGLVDVNDLNAVIVGWGSCA